MSKSVMASRQQRDIGKGAMLGLKMLPTRIASISETLDGRLAVEKGREDAQCKVGCAEDDIQPGGRCRGRPITFVNGSDMRVQVI